MDEVANFGFDKTLPIFMMFGIDAQSCDLNEVLVGAEEVKLFEESVP